MYKPWAVYMCLFHLRLMGIMVILVKGCILHLFKIVHFIHHSFLMIFIKILFIVIIRFWGPEVGKLSHHSPGPEY